MTRENRVAIPIQYKTCNCHSVWKAKVGHTIWIKWTIKE